MSVNNELAAYAGREDVCRWVEAGVGKEAVTPLRGSSNDTARLEMYRSLPDTVNNFFIRFLAASLADLHRVDDLVIADRRAHYGESSLIDTVSRLFCR